MAVQDFNCKGYPQYEGCQPVQLTTVQKTHAALLCIGGEDLEITADESNSISWTDISEGNEAEICNAVYCGISSNHTVSMASCLHELADSLPFIGATVDVLWIAEENTLPEIGDNLELFGAMKRLVEWNAAAITYHVTSGEQAQSRTLQSWVDVLRARVVAATWSAKQPSDWPPLWRGHVAMAGNENMKATRLCGFELHGVAAREDAIGVHVGPVVQDGREWKPMPPPADPDVYSHLSNRVLSRHLELLAELDIRDIPAFYIKNCRSKLVIPTESRLVKRSRAFLTHLEDHPWLGYLVRLDYGSAWSLVENEALVKDKESQELKGWDDLVSQDVSNILNCPFEGEMKGDLGQYLFLLCSPSCPMAAGLSGHAGDAGGPDPLTYCWAFAVRQPHEISGAPLLETLGAAHAPSTAHEGDSEEPVVDDLPELLPAELSALIRSVEDAQLGALRDWIAGREAGEQPAQITAEELSSLLQRARRQCLETIQLHSTTSRPRGTCTGTAGKQQIQDLDPLTLPERLALIHRCNRNGAKLTRYKSSDNLAGLSPPARGFVLTLDAVQFLKYFNRDGTPRTSTVVPIKGASRNKLAKVNSGEFKATPWPDCTNYNYHDVYYNQSQSEDSERRADRLKSRLQAWETESTCSYRKPQSLAAILVDPDKPAAVQSEAATVPPPSDRAGGEDAASALAAINNGRDGRGGIKRAKRLSAMRKAETGGQNEAPRGKPPASGKLPASAQAKSDAESRSQRHKRKLELIVRETLLEEGVQKGDPMFKSCALKLYTITKCFVKDLTSSRNLRQEMEKLARSNVKQIIDFERDRMKHSGQ